MLSRKSKTVYTFKLNPLYTDFLHSIKLSGYNIGTKLDKYPFSVKQNNYGTEIENACIVYNLDAWPKTN